MRSIMYWIFSYRDTDYINLMCFDGRNKLEENWEWRTVVEDVYFFLIPVDSLYMIFEDSVGWYHDIIKYHVRYRCAGEIFRKSTEQVSVSREFWQSDRRWPNNINHRSYQSFAVCHRARTRLCTWRWHMATFTSTHIHITHHSLLCSTSNYIMVSSMRWWNDVCALRVFMICKFALFLYAIGCKLHQCGGWQHFWKLTAGQNESYISPVATVLNFTDSKTRNGRRNIFCNHTSALELIFLQWIMTMHHFSIFLSVQLTPHSTPFACRTEIFCLHSNRFIYGRVRFIFRFISSVATLIWIYCTRFEYIPHILLFFRILFFFSFLLPRLIIRASVGWFMPA